MPVLTGSASADLDAPIERCWAVVQDVATAPQWQHSLERVDVLERDEHDRAVVCDTVTDAKISKVHSRVRFSYRQPTLVSWTQFEGDDLDLMSGSWRLEDLGNGRTRVTYSIEVDPGPLGKFARGPIQRIVRALVVGSRPRELAKRVAEA